MLGTEHAAGAAPDGHTLLMGTSTTFAANPHLFRRVNYSLAQFRPISLLIRVRLALYANADLPADDMAGVVALAKAAPQPLPYGVTARGNSTHLTGEALKIAAGIEMTDVPCTTGSMQQGLIRGDIPLAIDGIPAWLGLARERRVKVIGVTGEGRVGALPEVPTFGEAGLSDSATSSGTACSPPPGSPRPSSRGCTRRRSPPWPTRNSRSSLTHGGCDDRDERPDRFAALIAEETEASGRHLPARRPDAGVVRPRSPAPRCR